MGETESKQVVAGVDVASQELVVCISDNRKIRRFENRAKGLNCLVRELQKRRVALVVLEYTGRHERGLLKLLWKAQIPVHCAHPKSVHNFGKVLRANAKSDPLDALLLAEYGLAVKLAPTEPPAAETLEMQELASRRADLNEILVQERNRLYTPELPAWKRSSMQRHIRYLERELAAIESRMRQLTEKHGSLARPIATLTEEYGVGFLTAATVLAHVPELGKMNRQRVAALLGLAPFVRTSGKWVGQAKIYGGRTAARSALYMAALTVIRKRSHPLRGFYLRLKAANKKTNEALTAVMRKLAIRLNTRMKAYLNTPAVPA